jgi:signal peptidase I
MVGRGARPVTSNDPRGPDATIPGGSDSTAVLTPAPVVTEPSGPVKEPSRASGAAKRARRIVIEWVILIGLALVIAFLIKTFLFQAFYIPSGSMEPTLNIGDRVLVNKLSYDLHEVHRGDIVVFEAPKLARSGEIEDLVKRVIGLPGETVTADPAGSVLVNGRRLKEPYLPDGTTTKFDGYELPGCGPPADGSDGCVVPAGKLLVLGDNRNFSKDGRVFGPIEESSIVGRVFVRIWPLSDLGTL